MRNGWRALLVVAAGKLLLMSAAWADAPVTARVDLTYLGQQANGGGWAPSLSGDGRFLAFQSWATDLLPSGNPNGYNVYLRDLALGKVSLISSAGTAAPNGESLYPALSANGQYVAFSSVASNLVPGDENGVSDVFVCDWASGNVERVSIANSGQEADQASSEAAISGDGRYVAFCSEATNLVAGGNPFMAIYVRDRLSETTECVSVSAAGELANQISFSPSISRDGRYVAFISWASNLVPGDTNNVADVFVRDRLAGTTERVSVASDGSEADDSSNGSRPALTPDGRFIVFSSLAGNLVAGDTNKDWDVFLRDRVNGTTERVSVSSAGTEGDGASGGPSYVLASSGDGRYVEFASVASNLVPDDTNRQWDVFLRDRQLGTTERLSVSSAGVEGNAPSGYYGLALSEDARFQVFDSHAHNLVPNDSSKCIDTYARFVQPSMAVTATASVPSIAAGKAVALSASAVCSLNESDFVWSWTDGGAGGTFAPSASVQNPTYLAPSAGSGGFLPITLTATRDLRAFLALGYRPGDDDDHGDRPAPRSATTDQPGGQSARGEAKFRILTVVARGSCQLCFGLVGGLVI